MAVTIKDIARHSGVSRTTVRGLLITTDMLKKKHAKKLSQQ